MCVGSGGARKLPVTEKERILTDHENNYILAACYNTRFNHLQLGKFLVKLFLY